MKFSDAAVAAANSGHSLILGSAVLRDSRACKIEEINCRTPKCRYTSRDVIKTVT